MKIENFSKIYLYRVKVYEETTQLPQATSSNSANYNNYFENKYFINMAQSAERDPQPIFLNALEHTGGN